MPDRVHVFGASGSGTTTLAAGLAAAHGHRHLDTDDFYWLPTSPPFREPRPVDARLALLRQALGECPRWVLSGSLCGWGDPLVPEFDLVVLLFVPSDVRLARLRARECGRYGRKAIAPGGALHEAHLEFMAWAGRYDTGGPEMRSHAMHEAWLSRLPNAQLRLDGARPVAELLRHIEVAMQRNPR
jgi:adenylate kinase family enzyme